MHTSGRSVEHDLTVLDLFAGAGGLTEGLRRGGRFRSVQAVEMDVTAAATYHVNHPSAKVFVGPIEEWLEQGQVPNVDVVVGGPPCQGFSTLGRQDAEDARNELWRQYARTIVLARPKYFVVENVPAFLDSSQYRQFKTETRPGGALGDYRFEAEILNAADYGAPQRRKRVLLIGHHRDLPFPGWPTKTHEGGHVSLDAALMGVPKKVSTTVLPEAVADPWVDGSVRFGASTRVPKTLPGIFSTRELHIGRTYQAISMERFRSIPEGGNRFDIPDELLAPCWRTHTSGSADVMGRLRAKEPSVTIRTEFFKPEKGRYLHPTEHRAITHYEAARIQGFPESYRWVGSKVAIARQIGNAVPIALGAAVGRALLNAGRA